MLLASVVRVEGEERQDLPDIIRQTRSAPPAGNTATGFLRRSYFGDRVLSYFVLLSISRKWLRLSVASSGVRVHAASFEGELLG